MHDKSNLGDPRIREQAMREIEILQFINKVDHQKGFVVRLLDQFKLKKSIKGNQRAFICLIFEPLEMNLYELLAVSQPLINNFQSEYNIVNGEKQLKGLSLSFVRIIGWQILVALSLMSMPNINIIHCDLKPENIMLKE